MSECVFCQIVEGHAPCHRVYEDDHILAFMDIFPAAPGHTLVIPKVHAVDLFEIDDASLAAVSSLTPGLARALKKVIEPDGLMVMQLNGAAAGQTVFHYHTHLIPRHEGKTLALQPRVPGDNDELAQWAQQIRHALD